MNAASSNSSRDRAEVVDSRRLALSTSRGLSGVPVPSPDSSQRLAMTVSACLLDCQALPSSLDLIRQGAEALTADRPVMLPPGHRDPAHHVGFVADLAIPCECVHHSQEFCLRQNSCFHPHDPAFLRRQLGAPGPSLLRRNRMVENGSVSVSRLCDSPLYEPHSIRGGVSKEAPASPGPLTTARVGLHPDLSWSSNNSPPAACRGTWPGRRNPTAPGRPRHPGGRWRARGSR